MPEEPVIQAETAPEIPQDVATEETPADKALSEPDAIDPLVAPYVTNPFFYEVANYFGVEQKDYEYAKDKLATIVDWAFEETKSKKPEDLLLKIRELEDTLSSPDFGERRYSNVYKYVRLASRKQSLDKAMKSFQKKGERNGDTVRPNAD